MSVEDSLKKIIITRYGSVKQFAVASGMPYQTVVSILKRGIMKSGLQNIIDMCKVLNISVDALAEGKIISLPANDFNVENKVTELPELVETYVNYLENNDECTLDNEKISEEEVDFFIDGVNIIVEQIRSKRCKNAQHYIKKALQRKMNEGKKE